MSALEAPDDPLLKAAEEALEACREIADGDLTEDGLALWFGRYRPEYRRVADWGRWMRWDGRRWAPDSTLSVYSDIRGFLRARAKSADDEPVTRRLRSAQTVAAVERLAQSNRDYAATVDQWDTHHWVLNTPSGVLDLKTGTLRPHDRDLHLTKLTAVAPGGRCPLWEQFLLEITAGDTELVEFLQRMAGYCLTGSVAEHAMFFCYGTGGNGKGVLLNTLSALLGDYATVAPMEAFTASNVDRHPTELAMLRGARLVTAQETEEGRRWAESRIKALTGGDPIRARFMRQDFFQFHPTFKLAIAGNHKPRVRAVDEAIRRRFHLVPFTVTITEERRDLQLPAKLEAEWPGILSWCLAGCLDYQAHGLKAPEAVRNATQAYFEAQDLLADWLTHCCDVDPEKWERPSAAYRSWSRFADAAGERPGRQVEFVDRLEAHGFRQGKSPMRGRHWRGFAVRQAESPDWTS